MKLYAFTPKGHGQKSFFVIAENEDEASELVSKKIDKILACGKYSSYDFNGWGTDYYSVEFFEVGQVALNDND